MTRLRTILRGALALSAMEGVTLLLSLALLPYLMRVLGPAGFGRYAFGIAAAGALTMLVDYGFNQLGPKVVAQAEPDATAQSRIFWGIQAAKLALAAGTLLGLMLLALSMNLGSSYGDVLAAAPLGAAAAWCFPQWYLQGLHRYRTVALSLVVARLGAAAALLLFVRQPGDAALAVWLQVAIGPVAGGLALLDGRYRQALRWQRPQGPAVLAWLRSGGPLFVSTAAIALYTTCVPLVLGALTSPAVVGLFSAADKARIAGQTLIAPLTAASFPRLSRWMREDVHHGLRAARQVMWLQVGIGLLGTLGILLLARPLLLLLVGPSFLPAVATAQILGLCLLFTALTNALGVQVMLPLNMERAFAAILGGCAIIGLILAVVLSPLWLDKGAAVAVLSTEVLIVACMAAHLRRRGVSVLRAQLRPDR